MYTAIGRLLYVFFTHRPRYSVKLYLNLLGLSYIEPLGIFGLTVSLNRLD